VQISFTSANTPANLGLMRKVSVPGIRALKWPDPESTPSPVMTCKPSTRRRFRFWIFVFEFAIFGSVGYGAFTEASGAPTTYHLKT
jgi:hypothetical protein